MNGSRSGGPVPGASPPAWLERLLRVVLPRAERDFVLGDLREEFEVRRARTGGRHASLWYVAEAARSLWPFMTLPGDRFSPGDWRRDAMTGLLHDLRGAGRLLVAAPGFAAVVVLTIAIGVGGASAVYSVVDGVLLSPLPIREPERVVMLWGRTPDYPRTPLTVGDYNELVAGVESFESVAAHWSNNALILGEAEAEQVSVGWVTPGYFDLLGVPPARGRPLAEDDQNAILLSHDLWARRYGGDPSVVGDVVDLSGDPFEVAGVLPAGRDPNLTAFSGNKTDHQVWRLMPPQWIEGDDRSVGWLRSTARLRDEVTLAQAQAEVDALMARINETVTDRDGGEELEVDLVTARTDLVGDVSRTLWILLGAVCGVLLIAATNVAHLMLGRGELRSREIAVRASLGASRIRLVRQFLIESGVLAIAGAAAGLLVSSWAIRGLLALAPPTLPRLELVALDAGVFVFAFAATAVTAIVFGVLPAIRVTGVDAAGSLGERRGTGDRRQQRLSRGLVVAQVALSLALVTGTGLLVRSLDGLRGVDLGFDTEGIVTFALEAPSWGEDDAAAAVRMSEYIAAIEGVPGVSRAGFTNRVPLGGGLYTGTFRTQAMVAADKPAVETAVRYVTPGYREAMGARLSAGRDLRAEDGPSRVLVDETVAERSWPGENPLGQRLEIDHIGADPEWAEVVGVVAPMKHHGVAEPAVETIFSPMLPRAGRLNFRYMAVRVAGEPGEYLEALRAAARSVDDDAVLARVRTMSELFEEDVAATTFATALLSLFGVAALVLATVGLHGVMAVSMRSRRREMGIRMALGAEPGALLRSAVGSGAFLVVAGIVVGTGLSLGLGWTLRSLLFGVGPTDIPTLAAAAGVILTVGLLGAWLPARIVLRVDPAGTLRDE